MVQCNLVNEVVSEVIAFAHFEYIYSTKNDREEVMRFYLFLFIYLFFALDSLVILYHLSLFVL